MSLRLSQNSTAGIKISDWCTKNSLVSQSFIQNLCISIGRCPEHTSAHTHDSQCAKNKLSLLIFRTLNQADVTLTLTKVATTLTAAALLSPSWRPSTMKSDSHVGADIRLCPAVARDQARETSSKNERVCVCVRDVDRAERKN